MIYQPQRITPSRRPVWLIIVMLLLTLHQIGAILHALQIPSETAQSLSLPPSIQIIAASFWALIFAHTTISLLQRRRQIVKRAFLQIAVFIGYSVLRLFIFAQSDYDRQRLPFLLALTLPFAVLLLCAQAFVNRHAQRSDGNMGTRNGQK
jgi:4-amino-4-deoxy-L-arabinose transferase-like glycosyltransferase